jgi:hypothetical protein
LPSCARVNEGQRNRAATTSGATRYAALKLVPEFLAKYVRD